MGNGGKLGEIRHLKMLQFNPKIKKTEKKKARQMIGKITIQNDKTERMIGHHATKTELVNQMIGHIATVNDK